MSPDEYSGRSHTGRQSSKPKLSNVIVVVVLGLLWAFALYELGTYLLAR